MAPARDLREWIALLEREGELVRVAAEVDPHLEVTEIVDRTVRAGGPALLFQHPKGSQHPLLINQFGTERRMCLAFGVERLDDVAARLADVLEMQPPEGLAAKVRGLKTLKSIADSRPKVVRRGVSQEVVLRGDEVDLGNLPVQWAWPGDAGPFITLPAIRAPAAATWGCTACRCSVRARQRCTGRSTRTAARTTCSARDGWRWRSRWDSTRSRRTRRARRSRSTSTS
jgi:UbiD family decarboxylase